MPSDLRQRSIEAFGDQWQRYRENESFYAEPGLLRDMFETLLTPDDIKGCRVAEIGSGAGRIVNMLLAFGASHVVALEPSSGFDVLQKNLAPAGDKVTLLNLPGEAVPAGSDFDMVFCIGVLHHIPEPLPVLKAALASLRPGGRLAIWLYGHEGNGLYLAMVQPLRLLCKRLPDDLLDGLVGVLDPLLRAYMWLCRRLPLPLRGYFNHVLGKFDDTSRRLVIFDQLNPPYSKYYTRQEAQNLVAAAGFTDIQMYHRHGYSWSVVARKPEARPK
jgi:SAM-dependent methyltransferase